MSKLITVFGAIGNQGGSVIRTSLDDPLLSQECNRGYSLTKSCIVDRGHVITLTLATYKAPKY